MTRTRTFYPKQSPMSAPSRTVKPAAIARRLKQVMNRLGFANNPGLVQRWAEYKAVTSRHVVRQAFQTIGVQAVFGFLSSRPDRRQYYAPILYFAIGHDEKEADSIHRLVWSQGIVPIVLMATPTALQIRRTLAPPRGRPVSIPWDKLADDQAIPVELTSLTAVSLSSSLAWNDYAIDRRRRVDRALLQAITELNTEVRRQFPHLDAYPTLVNSIIGRFIYFFVLFDRGIVTASWIKSLRDSNGHPLCEGIAQSLLETAGIGTADIPWAGSETWALFDRIDDVLNGTIFPFPADDRKRVPDQALHLVRRSIRHGDVLRHSTRQLGFLDVSFATLRTETISAIYELFLCIESSYSTGEEGAFYTPPFLVDYVLDETDRIRPFTAKSRTLDPAAGSGIFLVGAYRRILERTMPRGRWKSKHFARARTLLEESIFGIERNPQAANVARFSLYLTLLDYVENAAIDALHALVKPNRVFPALTDSVLARDAFAINKSGADDIGRFTHVIGNPPWGSMGKRSGRANSPRLASVTKQRCASLRPAVAFFRELELVKFPVTNQRLSELFVWKILRDFLAPKGVLGVLISTRSFVGRTAHEFPNALAKQTRIVGLANMSHFRYRLFQGARSPALAIFAEARQPGALDPVWVYSPLLTSQPIGSRGHLWSIIVSEPDIEHHRLRDLTLSPAAWFEALMLRPIDRRFTRHLRLWSSSFDSTFGRFLHRGHLVMARGGTQEQTGLARALLLSATDYRDRLGLDANDRRSYPHELLAKSTPKVPFAKMFAGNIVLMPRHMNGVAFVRQPVAFVSSFNALYFSDDRISEEQRVLALQGVARFLDSNVARYLYALFGRTRMLDKARVEKNDLTDIPFPFGEVTDDELQRLQVLDEGELTKLFASKTGLDDSFLEAVEEYTSFRHEYEDAQIPCAAFVPPHAESVSQYRLRLMSELAQQFGPAAEITYRLNEPSEREQFAYISVSVARKATAGRSLRAAAFENVQPPALSGFSPHANVVYDPHTSCAAVAKPWARVAWTIEQAYSDARAIVERVLRSGHL